MMKSFVAVVSSLFLSLPVLASKPAPVLREAAVLAAVSSYRAAIAEGSLEKLAAVVEPELSVLEGTHLNQGWADYRDNHIGPEMKEWMAFRVADPALIEVSVAGDWAYAVGRATYTIVTPERSMVLAAAETFVLRERGGVWRVRHIHSSARKLREEKP